MLTKNYYAIWLYTATGTKAKVTNTSGTSTTPTLDMTYAQNAIALNKADYSSLNYIVFGDGTEAPTLDDYKLSGNRITNLSVQQTTYTWERLANGVKATRSMFVNNSNTDAVTISEIVWYGYCNSQSSIGNGDTVVIDRTLLDSPVTIAAGATAQINYSIFFPYGN